MKSISSILIALVSIGICLGQENSTVKTPFTLDEVRTRFNTQPKGDKKRDKYYTQFSVELHDRGVDFLLSLTDKKELNSKTGFTSHWITENIEDSIRDVKLASIIGSLDKENLYKVYLDSYYWIRRGRTRYALFAAKEYIRRYKSNNTEKDLTDYLERMIPYLERRYRESFRVD